MAKFPTYEEMAKNVAEKALDEVLYNGRSIREWMQIITSEDVISRRAAQAKINSICKEYMISGYAFSHAFDDLPPVTSQPKTGHWIIIDDCELFMAKCSECGEIVDSRMVNKYPYCHCGARMVEPLAESEDK